MENIENFKIVNNKNLNKKTGLNQDKENILKSKFQVKKGLNKILGNYNKNNEEKQQKRNKHVFNRLS